MTANQTLTDTERRVLGCPSHPMNVHEIVRYLHPRILVGTDGVDDLLRGPFSDRGWVKNLGRYGSAADAAVAGQNDGHTIDMPDDLAKTWARRLERDDLAWRLDGDLWMLTPTGWEELHAPVGDSPPFTVTEVQAAVDAEWARVEHDYSGGPLAEALLPQEFARWFTLIADECERVWNVRPRAPVAGGASGYSDAYEVAILNHENQKAALTTVDPIALEAAWYMALTVVQVTDAMTGSTITEAGYTGYTRKAVSAADMAVAVSPGGTATNVSPIVFAACTAGTSTVIGCANCAASTDSMMRKWGDVPSTVVSTAKTPATFGVGAYTTTLT